METLFGLTNFPATFQRLMNLILGDADDDSVMTYNDVIGVLSEKVPGHLQRGLYCEPRKIVISVVSSKPPQICSGACHRLPK